MRTRTKAEFELSRPSDRMAGSCVSWMLYAACRTRISASRGGLSRVHAIKVESWRKRARARRGTTQKPESGLSFPVVVAVGIVVQDRNGTGWGNEMGRKACTGGRRRSGCGRSRREVPIKVANMEQHCTGDLDRLEANPRVLMLLTLPRWPKQPQVYGSICVCL